MECNQLASLAEGEWTAISLDQIEILTSRLQECCISFSLLVQNPIEGSEGHVHCTKREGAMNCEGQNDACFQPDVARSGQRGRPSIILSPSQILFLRKKHFRWKDIATLLGISSRTLRRKVLVMGIDDSNFSAISDDELKNVMRAIQETTPNIGQSRMMGALRSRGSAVQRWEVCEHLHVLDPVGTTLRWGQAILRRKYYVPAPNSLWHIDGNHKKMDGYLCLLRK